ncbi:MAG: chloride channel protein [Clostridia bacterium]|nr:chloride channel protein [Clostridia bacterium]
MVYKNFSFKAFIKLFAASLILGLMGGSVGAAFSLTIGVVTTFRMSNTWILYFLPIGSVLIVFLYKKLGIYGQGTNTVLEAADSKQGLSPFLAIGVFFSATVSHLFGASVGREGAALQIGGGLAVTVSKLLRFDKAYGGILIRAGMAAVFSAVFGTPITAFLFAIEAVYVGTLHLKSALPSVIASFTAFFVSQLLGAHPERFSLYAIPDFSFDTAWKITVLTVLTATLSIGFCHTLQTSARLAKKIIKNPYLRIVIGGIIILGLTIIVGNQDYNGAGVNVIERIFESQTNPNSLSFKPEAFVLKLIFTCISVAVGFKGGEIVPTLFIGSTFGALLATIFGLSAPFGAALCMVLLFCGVTNCPLASIALGFELFSGVGFWYFVPTVLVCFILSGKISLYSSQKHKFKYL